jgi:glutathione S-transferase
MFLQVPSVPSQLLNPPSAAYFRRTREARFSSTLEALRDDPDKGGGKAFELMAPHLEKVAELYRKNQEGPFLEGKEVRYADLVVVAWMKMFDRLGRLEEVLAAQEKVGEGKELRGLWEASQRWLERDDR